MHLNEATRERQELAVGSGVWGLLFGCSFNIGLGWRLLYVHLQKLQNAYRSVPDARQ